MIHHLLSFDMSDTPAALVVLLFSLVSTRPVVKLLKSISDPENIKNAHSSTVEQDLPRFTPMQTDSFVLHKPAAALRKPELVFIFGGGFDILSPTKMKKKRITYDMNEFASVKDLQLWRKQLLHIGSDISTPADSEYGEEGPLSF